MTLSLIPSVKTLILHEGFLKEKTLRLSAPVADRRLLSVLRFFSVSGEGTELRILTGEGEGEGYRLSIREDGITVIMISHDIDAALRYADHILHVGKKIFFGTKEEYLESDAAGVFGKKGEKS